VKTLIKRLIAVINAVWIPFSEQVKFFSKSRPIRFRLWIAESGWIEIRETDHVPHCRGDHGAGGPVSSEIL